jgi:hypothetical protein
MSNDAVQPMVDTNSFDWKRLANIVLPWIRTDLGNPSRWSLVVSAEPTPDDAAIQRTIDEYLACFQPDRGQVAFLRIPQHHEMRWARRLVAMICHVAMVRVPVYNFATELSDLTEMLRDAASDIDLRLDLAARTVEQPDGTNALLRFTTSEPLRHLLSQFDVRGPGEIVTPVDIASPIRWGSSYRACALHLYSRKHLHLAIAMIPRVDEVYIGKEVPVSDLVQLYRGASPESSPYLLSVRLSDISALRTFLSDCVPLLRCPWLWIQINLQDEATEEKAVVKQLIRSAADANPFVENVNLNKKTEINSVRRNARLRRRHIDGFCSVYLAATRAVATHPFRDSIGVVLRTHLQAFVVDDCHPMNLVRPDGTSLNLAKEPHWERIALTKWAKRNGVDIRPQGVKRGRVEPEQIPMQE